MSFPAFVARGLKAERFALLDIGCSGGLDPKWRAFGDRLKALGIDASASTGLDFKHFNGATSASPRRKRTPTSPTWPRSSARAPTRRSICPPVRRRR